MNLLLLLLLLPQAGPSETPPSRDFAATVRYALGDEILGPWQGFAVELDNRAPREVDARIRIEDPSYESIVTRREILAAGARKRLFLYAPAGPLPRTLAAQYRILDAAGRELAAGRLDIGSSRSGPAPQVGLLCGDDRATPVGLEIRDLRLARLTPATFPDRWMGLAPLDLLVVLAAPLDPLSIDQTRALHDYVRHGGSVLFSPGAQRAWLAHPTVQALAPVRVGDSELLSDVEQFRGRYGPIPSATPFLFHPLQNGERLLPTNGRLALARFPAGFGRAFVSGVDLGAPPFDQVRGMSLLWRDLLSESSTRGIHDACAFNFATQAEQRGWTLEQMSRLVNPFPAFGLIFALAAVYVILVGPLNYWLFKRRRRTILLVVSVPAISFASLVFLLLLAYALKGVSTTCYTARLLGTSSGSEWALETQLLTLYSPSERTYDIAFPPGIHGGPAGRGGGEDEVRNRRPPSPTGPQICESGAALELRGIPAAQWQTKTFEAQGLRELGKGVRFSVQGGRLQIRNDSPYPIERGIYPLPSLPDWLAVPFGPVAPGAALEVPLDAPQPLRQTFLFAPDEPLGALLMKRWARLLTAPGQAPPPRSLLCILRDAAEPVRVNAPLSSRSRSVTLLRVEEAP